MTGTRHAAPEPEESHLRHPEDAGRAEDEAPDDEDEDLPDQLDLPIETPIVDAIESLQSAGDLDDDLEPHA